MPLPKDPIKAAETLLKMSIASKISQNRDDVRDKKREAMKEYLNNNPERELERVRKLKETKNSPDGRLKNSIAQTIAQNRSETKERHRVTMKEKYKSKSDDEKEELRKNNKKVQNRPDVVERKSIATTNRFKNPSNREKTSIATKNAMKRGDVRNKYLNGIKKREINKLEKSIGGFWYGNVHHLEEEIALKDLLNVIRKTPEYVKLKKEIYKRDNHRSVYTNLKGRPNAHHCKPLITICRENNIKSLADAFNCQDIWDPKNLVTMLEDEHSKWHSIFGQICDEPVYVPEIRDGVIGYTPKIVYPIF